MTDDLLASLGMYGGSAVVAFIAGLFPIISIEVFLVGVTVMIVPSWSQLLVCCLLAASTHQVAKTITYYAGAGALEHGRLKQRIDRARPRIEKWNKAPRFMLFLSGSIGFPPLYILGFIAHPLMGIGIATYTLIIFGTRLGRFIVLAGIPLVV